MENTSMSLGLEVEEFYPLSDKPFFDVVLAKTHLANRYMLNLPVKIQGLIPSPNATVELSFKGKKWKTRRVGSNCKCVNWEEFVVENNLELGDACVFELDECIDNIMLFKVHIIPGGIPDELLAKVSGQSSNCPIIVE